MHRERSLKILTWNVRASMTPRVLGAVGADDSIDVLVLTEYRVPRAGDLIAQRLIEAGWVHQARGEIPVGKKGVAIYSRCPITPSPELLDDNGALSQWLVPVSFPLQRLSLVGAYVPYPDGSPKEVIWQTLHRSAQRNHAESLLILGDFNSCYPHEADSRVGYTTHALETMERHAVDLWRAHGGESLLRDHITWEGPNGKGNRLDSAFGTPALTRRVREARHLHTFRLEKASDHSGVMVRIADAR